VPAPSTNSHSNPRAPSVTAPKANSNSGRPPATQPSPQSAPQPQQQPARAPLARDKPPLPVLTNENCAAYYAEPLPAFRDVPPSEKQLLLVKKLHLCSFTYDFTDQVPRRAGLTHTFVTWRSVQAPSFAGLAVVAAGSCVRTSCVCIEMAKAAASAVQLLGGTATSTIPFSACRPTRLVFVACG